MGEIGTDDDHGGADEHAVDDADALVVLMLDVLAPQLAWWRVEAGRRAGLDAAALTCVELARKHGRVSGALVMDRTGLTRSAVSKLVRRLESGGHVTLVGDRAPGKALEIAWSPHAARDAELAAVREEVRRRLRNSALPGIAPDVSSAAWRLLREAADCVHSATEQSMDGRAEARRLEARRRLRAAEGW